MGDYSKQPFFDAVFQNFRNDINPNPRNEKVSAFELGYGFVSSNFTANLNLYRTQWRDRLTVSYEDENENQGTADLQGIEQLHGLSWT